MPHGVRTRVFAFLGAVALGLVLLASALSSYRPLLLIVVPAAAIIAIEARSESVLAGKESPGEPEERAVEAEGDTHDET